MPLWAWIFIACTTIYSILIWMYIYSYQQGLTFRAWKNPLNVFFGYPTEHLNPVTEDGTWATPRIEDMLSINIGEFTGDEYDVNFELITVDVFRDHGPMWLRRFFAKSHFEVVWTCHEGIPCEPQVGYIHRGSSYGGRLIIEDDVYWRLEADKKLVKLIKRRREVSGWQRPIGRIDSIELKDDGLYVEGEFTVPPDQLPDWLSVGWQIDQGRMRVSSEQAEAALVWLEENLGKQHPPTILPDDGMIITPIDQIEEPLPADTDTLARMIQEERDKDG